jgi:putative serine/threonine protein kinase
MFKDIKNVKYFAKGKRSLIYTGIYKNQKVAIKTKNPKSEAKNRIKNEINYLKILNKYNIGPTLLITKEKYFVYKFVEDEFLVDYLKQTNDKYKIIKKVLDQCRILDKLKINKLEFTRPIKHIFVKNNKITMIDFERCYETNNPKNVTQFCQFIIKSFKTKKEFQEILKEYKNKQTEKNYKKILKYLKTIFSS